ncbi:hypothetical protein [Actinophytocola glycyrrhizae]|uniref:Guanylate cyclase domain-containing protein n=1 Tax=Actinophytocola glycyrrhizae TaxID=2044873 RepID=A0ABV9SC03_9PSEU
MTWTFELAQERAEDRYMQTADLRIEDVTRKIDFDNISRTRPRRVTGTHLYVDIVNFNRQLRAQEEDGDDGEELLRMLHVFAREVSKIIAHDFDGQKIHFQGPRVHALSYRPISDESTIAVKAVLTCLAIRHSTAVFNDVLDLDGSEAWQIAAGLDHGRCIATRNGAGGDQELLFLGGAANHAAKLLQSSGVRMTTRVYDLLPQTFQDKVEDMGDGTYRISLSASEVERLSAEYGWPWTRADSRKRLEDAAERYPVGSVTSTKVKEKIDKATLTLSNTKRVQGASIFADVDGFTSYIDGLQSLDDDLVEAIRLFHVIRGVMRDSAVQDFEALRIQYQGDRMQSLAYRPVQEEEKAALSAVRLAAALTSVADEVIPHVLPELPAHRLAIGLSWGQVLVSRVGEHGNTDVISLGGSTAAAATIQQRLDGGQIGLDRSVRDYLPAWLQQAFPWSSSVQAYVATDLTYNDLAILEASEQKDRALGALAATTAVVGLAAAGAVVLSRKPAKPWSNG